MDGDGGASGTGAAVRVYWYSQTGQLREALQALLDPVERSGVRVHWHEVRPRTPYPFPWPLRRFLGLFLAASDPAARIELERPPPPPQEGDLVILGYQVWYLATSLPIRAVLQSGVLRGCSVVSVIACRDMWYSAALEVRRRLDADGADHLGTVAAVDTAPTLVTFVTTLRWLLRGRRGPFWFFPAAGVGPSEHDRLSRLGQLWAAELARAPSSPSQRADRIRRLLVPAGAAAVVPHVAAADLLAGTLFRRAGAAIRRRRRPAVRAVLLGAFIVALPIGILTVIPALALLATLARLRTRSVVRGLMEPALGGAPRPEGPRTVRGSG